MNAEASGAGRRWMSRGSLALSVIVVPLLILSLWMRIVLLDSDRFSNTVASLAYDEGFQLELVETISAESDIRIRQLLLVAAGQRVKTIVDRMGGIDLAVAEIIAASAAYVSSAEFPDAWRALNATAHSWIHVLLRGGEVGGTRLDGNNVLLDLNPIIALIAPDDGTLVEQLLGTISLDEPIEVQVFNASIMDRAEWFVRYSNRLVFAFAGLSLVFGVIGIATGHRKMKALGIAILVAGGVAVIVLVLTATFLTDELRSVESDIDRSIANDYVNAVLDSLGRTMLISAIALSISGGLILLIDRFRMKTLHV